jgi:hypothetical protein
VRTIDQQGVTTAYDRALEAIKALAQTTAATATTIAAQLAGTVGQQDARISALEKSSYEGKGKQTLSDPMMTDLLSEMKSLRESRAGGTGRTEGISMIWGVILGAGVLIGTLFGIAAYFKR